MRISTLSAALMAGIAIASPIAKPDFVVDWVTTTIDITITAGQPTPSVFAASIPQGEAFEAPAQNPPSQDSPLPSPPAPAVQSHAPAEFFEAPPPSSSQPAPVASPTPSPPPSSGSSSPSGVINGVDVGSLMTKHNDYRSQHGASPLSWDQSLSDGAMQHAQQCQFVHNTQDERMAGNYGQNMFASTEQSAEEIGTTVDSWYSEYTKYPFSSPPTDMDESWGHFSQLVWKSSGKVGCANFYCNSMTGDGGAALTGLHSFVVCNYQTPGNYEGEFAQNVS